MQAFIPANWDKMTLADQRRFVARTIGAFLFELENRGRPPDDWEREHFANAIECMKGGIFRLALEYVSLAGVPKEKRPPRVSSTQPPLRLTLDDLRRALEQASSKGGV